MLKPCPACRLLAVFWGILLNVQSEEKPSSSEPAEPVWPQAALSNGVLKLTVYLPDAEKGYYRGPRFDWSGLVAQVEHSGHTFFEEWSKPHKPDFHDHAIGPAEEFGMQTPLGYTDAKPGEAFIKIGIGHLERKNAGQYLFWGDYKIVKPAVWKVSQDERSMTFEQTVSDERGWGYEYVKRIELAEGKPVFSIRHRLKNTGTKPIDTDHYCHNFFLIDQTPIGKHYRLSFLFEVKPDPKVTVLSAEGKALILTEDPEKAFFTPLTGFEGPEGNQVRVENLKTGAWVEIVGNIPPLKFNLFGVPSAVCPEPYIAVKVGPGEESEWTNRYEFGFKEK